MLSLPRPTFLSLGLSLLACAVFFLCGPSPASAEGGLRSETSPIELQGEQTSTMVLEIPGAGKVECSHVTITGNLTGPVFWPSYTVSTHFTSCKAFGFATAHANWTDCALQFTVVEVIAGGGFAIPHIECGAGKNISITPTVFGVSSCTMTISAQTPGGEVDLTNQGSGSSRDVLMTFTLQQISHSKTCGASGEKDAKLTGTITMKAFSGAVQKGLWVE